MMPRDDYAVKWIPVGELSVLWAQSQRPISERKVKDIMDSPDPDALGVLTVTLPNGKGVHHIIDGQHRAEAFRRLWGDKEKLPCLILPSKSPKEAAHIWRLVNGKRTKPGALEAFRVGVTAGYENETVVDDLMEELGYRIETGKSDGSISCVGALLSIQRKHGTETLRRALLLIQATWGTDRDSVHSAIVQGFAHMVATHHGVLDPKRMADRVSKKFTPARFIGAARQARGFNGGALPAGVASVLTKAYNNGLAPERRLPE